MRSVFLLCGLSAAAAMGQSMLEVGGIVAGSSVGSAAGKKLSDSLNSTLKKTAGAAEKAAKAEPEKPKQKAAQQQAEVPEPAPIDPIFAPPKTQGKSGSELNNVPPPPPPKKKPLAQQPVRAARVPAPIVTPVRYEASKPEPLNVDLSLITTGMRRDDVLKLGQPSARISMYENGHLLEIYNYRNATFPSGSLRLQDGSVTSIEPRP